ncbi:MAG: Cof-type HAD-IIB family hydrolase [Gudongella sp.]|nr:Cof-type HAD-IIB family hydrolase [Gudongella sp.]
MYKLIAIDLDGTLLDDSKKISDFNLEVLNRLIEKGYEVVIATGRRYFSAKSFLTGIKSHLIILANNGNIVRNSEDDKTIMSKFMDKESYLDLLKEANDLGLKGIVHVDLFYNGIDMIFELDEKFQSQNKYIFEDDNRYLILPKLEIEKQERVLAVVYPGDADIIYKFSNIINTKYPNRYNSHVLERIYRAEAMYEAMNPMGTKWKSLLEYANTIGIKKEEIICIGDDNNDIEMLLCSGLGIAMKNSNDLVKKSANLVTEKDNNESGVGSVLTDLLIH